MPPLLAGAVRDNFFQRDCEVVQSRHGQSQVDENLVAIMQKTSSYVAKYQAYLRGGLLNVFDGFGTLATGLLILSTAASHACSGSQQPVNTALIV